MQFGAEVHCCAEKNPEGSPPSKCQLTISAATPNKNVAKKAATDELGSAVKEPVAKKAKVKCLPPPLELSANTKAILRSIDKGTEEFWNLEEVLSANVNGQSDASLFILYDTKRTPRTAKGEYAQVFLHW